MEEDETKVVPLFSKIKMSPRLLEDQVTQDSLHYFLEAAVIEHEVDGDGDIYLKDGVNYPLWVLIDADSKLIRFYTYLNGNGCSVEEVNELNSKYKIVQFSLDQGHDRVQAYYYMTFHYGFDVRQLIVMARKFGSICRTVGDELERDNGGEE